MGAFFVSCGWLYTAQLTSMNKIIFPNDRLLMYLVGPGGSEKTRLIFAMFASPTTFCPKLQKICYFYKENKPLFREKTEKLNIKFVPCLGFEMIKKLENCSLVFDDSCGEIYQEKEFVQIAVDGRHKEINYVFIR